MDSPCRHWTAIWAQMKLKPTKSGCMVRKKVQIKQKYSLKIQGKEIQSIIDTPSSFGENGRMTAWRTFNNNKHLDQQTTERLANIDKSGLPGKFKASVDPPSASHQQVCTANQPSSTCRSPKLWRNSGQGKHAWSWPWRIPKTVKSAKQGLKQTQEGNGRHQEQ